MNLIVKCKFDCENFGAECGLLRHFVFFVGEMVGGVFEAVCLGFGMRGVVEAESMGGGKNCPLGRLC